MPEITREELDQAADGQTITSRFLDTVRAHPNQVGLREKQGDGSYVEWTYADYADHVAGAAAYLRGLGVEPGDRVVLMMRNVPAFHFIDLGIAALGATAISIYNSSSPEQVAYLAGHCKAKVALVEDDGFEERFLKVREELPHLGTIVNLSHDGVAQEIFHGGTVDLAEVASASTPDTLATVIYTSGTTGPPKGVMITHRNVVWTAEGYLRMLDVDPVGFRAVSYLPMAHIAERMSTHYLAVLGGYEVTDCPDAGQIAAYAREVRPQIMFGVPRVWEKIHAGVQAALGADPEKKAKFDEAVAAAIPISERRTMGAASAEDDATWQFLDEAAFAGVRALVGLDAVEYAITGAAPIPAELISWYRAIGVPLSEIYGMSESTGPMTWEPTRVKAGTVGTAFPGTDCFLADDGEVCIRGGNVFQGYLDDPEKTAEALDADGTLHSGDIGEFDDEGYLRIIDRKKELIITAGGKNISPANLEAELKMIPLVAQACAIGDHKPFVSALVVLDAEVAPVWAKDRGIEFSSLAELAEHPDVIAEVNKGVEEAMAGFNNAERVKKVTILHEEWLPDSEELTPTSKLKRRGIHAKYAEEIDALYAQVPRSVVAPRVVSLVPSVTETLLAWGIRPVACTRFCEQPDLLHVGGTKDPAVADILVLTPDLVVLDEEENRREDHDALVAAGLDVHVLAVRDLAGLDAQMDALAASVGAAWEPIGPRLEPAPARRAWVPIWKRPWMALGEPTYGSAVLRALGVANVAAALGAYPEVDPDAARRGDADVVIAPSEPYPFAERHRTELARAADDVRFVDGRDLLWWGTRTRGALERLSIALA